MFHLGHEEGRAYTSYSVEGTYPDMSCKVDTLDISSGSDMQVFSVEWYLSLQGAAEQAASKHGSGSPRRVPRCWPDTMTERWKCPRGHTVPSVVVDRKCFHAVATQ